MSNLFPCVFFPAWRLILLYTLVIAALLICGVLQARAASSGPLASLALVQKSIDEADSSYFTQAVDIDAVIAKAADSLKERLAVQVSEGKLGSNNLTMALALAGAADAAGQSDLLRAMLASEVKSFVASGINGGYFSGAPNGSVKLSRGSLNSTLKKLPQGRREVVPGQVLSTGNGTATVSATFVDPDAGRLPLILTMENTNGSWRVVEIVNAAELFDEATRNAKN